MASAVAPSLPRAYRRVRLAPTRPLAAALDAGHVSFSGFLFLRVLSAPCGSSLISLMGDPGGFFGGQLLYTPLGQDDYWYRYHPLLAEFLRQRSAARHGTEVAELHRRAARWFARRSFATAMARALRLGPCANSGPRDCGGVDPVRARNSRADRRRTFEQGDRPVARHRARDGQVTREEYLRQALGREASPDDCTRASLGLLRTV
jgi:hypothetical protein